jgi:hypothetical protein
MELYTNISFSSKEMPSYLPYRVGVKVLEQASYEIYSCSFILQTIYSTRCDGSLMTVGSGLDLTDITYHW